MNPTDFPQANHTFQKPSSMTDEQCGALAVHQCILEQLPCSISRWEPTPEERRAIAAGAPVWLYVYGLGHPVVALTADPPWPEAASAPTPTSPGPDPILDLGDEGDAALPGGPGTPPHLKDCTPAACAPGCAWREAPKDAAAAVAGLGPTRWA